MNESDLEGIRPATPADLGGIAELFVRVFRAPPYAEEWELSVAQRYLGDLMSGSASAAFLAPSSGGTPAGFLVGACHGAVRALIYEIAVDERCRSRGIGTALLDRFLEEARRRGVRTVELLARRDLPAYGFYRRRGFRVPRRVVFLVRSV